MTDPRDLDPSPFEDMPSDMRFRLYLDALTPEDVVHELDPPIGSIEARWLGAANRRKKDLL